MMERSKVVENSVSWNYSTLARPYLKRPNYSEGGIDAMLAITKTPPGALVCDVGAGIGHLTIPLSQRHLTVIAVEPNDEMRRLGMERTRDNATISWRKGTGEATGFTSGTFELVAFGSSFNVTDRELALKETNRILRPSGWFACMWNHRDLDDPLQRDVESLIKSKIPDYDYGTRRTDQTQIIIDSNLFKRPFHIEAPVCHKISVSDWIEAWRSHATLDRQSNGRLDEIVKAIEDLVVKRGEDELVIPYTTRIWGAQRFDNSN
jgi:ubiquinone/menaquinone biosynthesis C-methylase UbiE